MPSTRYNITVDEYHTRVIDSVINRLANIGKKADASNAIRQIVEKYADRDEQGMYRLFEDIKLSLSTITRALFQMDKHLVNRVKQAANDNPDILNIKRTLGRLETLVRNIELRSVSPSSRSVAPNPPILSEKRPEARNLGSKGMKRMKDLGL